MTTISLFLIFYTSFVLFASFAHLIRLDYWWIRIWDFPHLQVSVMTLLGLLAWAVFGHAVDGPASLLPIGLVAASFYQGWLIYPYTALHKREVRSTGKDRKRQGQATDPDTLRLLTANVYQENKKTGEVLELIEKHQPDILLLLETNKTWKQAMSPIEKDFPHQIHCPLENMYGLLFYSRLPMVSHELRFLNTGGYPLHIRTAHDGIGTACSFLRCPSYAAEPDRTLPIHRAGCRTVTGWKRGPS
ncbi:endonuclease/exonuclease/phosphatase (EEP) superfamily protein YafD [Spirosoma sp. LMG 31448]|nr:endonuclease/exonuclease/phosphatase family protein [Spirosoma utsteinense]MBC3786386.1 endonuclease/exonuclease/phosphatase (EEP) superfamily protein YafD [Spirosoma utsteinense]